MHPYALSKGALSQFIPHVKNSSAISTESFEFFFSKIILLFNGKNGGSLSTQKVTQANYDGLRM